MWKTTRRIKNREGVREPSLIFLSLSVIAKNFGNFHQFFFFPTLMLTKKFMRGKYVFQDTYGSAPSRRSLLGGKRPDFVSLVF